MSIRSAVTLFLMTEKGHYCLQQIASRFKGLIHKVIIGTDKSVKNDYSSEIKKICLQYKIDYCFQHEHSGAIETSYAIAISWRRLINHPSDKLIIFHDSLLPRYRGFAPLVNSLINQEKKIGVTALFGEKNFDTGPIISMASTCITYPIRIRDAIDLVKENYVEILSDILEKISSGAQLTGNVQDEREASYSVWRDEYDYLINWSDSAEAIRRFIDAVGFPYSGAKAYMNGDTVRILEAEVYQDVVVENRDVGKVLFLKEGNPIVICGSGLLKITQAVIEDKGKEMDLLPLKRIRSRFSRSGL